MVEIAEKHNALLLALEHRYYGLSMPPESNTDWSTSSLKYLSSEQAVADIAEFHAYISKKYDLTSANRWITFGGSYPGMMSGFARLKLPHLIFASISSSSPWQAQTNMPEYNYVVGESIKNPKVGGSSNCYEVVKTGHMQIKEMLRTKQGREELSKMFNICGENTHIY